MGDFGNSMGKKAVRELWNTPLLKYLHLEYNVRFRYMGLPGVDLLDIKLWQDMIDEIIAFERPTPIDNTNSDPRRDIISLRRNLRLTDVPSYAYYGPMEEVIILGQDYENTIYEQDKFVTLYNLDFCDEIASQINTSQQGKQIWRFEAIRQILLDQQRCYREGSSPGLFVILLTIRNQIAAHKLKSFLLDDPYHDTQNYFNICTNKNPLPQKGSVQGTHTWALKAFLFQLMRSYLAAPHISAVFFPIVKYHGKTPGSPMLHFMILCRFDERHLHAPLHLPQRYLTDVSSIKALDEYQLIWEPEPGELQNANSSPNSVQWLENQRPRILHGRGLRRTRPSRQIRPSRST